MAIRPYYPNDTDNETVTAEQLLTDFPNREVFVKDTDDSIIGTGMRLLEDGTLLAPEGFSVESGSIDFGDVIKVSEASGFLGIRNNLYNASYQIIDYHVPRDDVSDNPQIFKLNEAEKSFVAQPDFSTVLSSNPLFFNYTTMLNARTNSLTFKANAPMMNVRIRVVKSDVNVALKYLPTKSSWTLGTGGYNFVAGDNVIDFGDSPVPLIAGTMLTFEIRADSVSLLGNSSGVAYFSGMLQEGGFVNLPLSTDVTSTAIKAKLESLSSPNKLSKTAVQDAVLSVNGQFGDVLIDYEDVGAQEQSSTLQEIADLGLTPNTFFHVHSDGSIDLEPVTDAGLDFISQPNFDSQKNLLGLADVASSGSYNDLVDTPTIPAAQVNSDWNALSGVAQILNKPLSFPPSSHTHVISDVTGLQTALDAKFNIPSGTITQYVRGNGSLATFPVNVSSFTNDSGYLTSITSGQVTTALGYTPYNGTTNPNSYITQAGARSAISLTTTGTSGAATYNSSTGVLNVPVYANSGGTVTSITAGIGLSGGTITTTGTISMPNVGTPGTYNSVTTDAQGRVTAGTTRSFTSPTRSLNSAFQISTTRDVYVSYATDIACSATVLVGQSGTVVLEYADNSGMSTNVVTVQQSTASASGVLNMATIATATLTGVIPVGKYVRLRTVNNVGSPTFSYRTAQEVLL